MTLTAKNFIERLKANQSDDEQKKIRRYFKADDPENRVIGVRMKHTFDLAKKFKDMPLDEIEKLLDSPWYESRMGAVSIMDFRVRRKDITEDQRKNLFDLYLNKHNRLNNWDFMDRAAPRVIGSYLFDYDKPRDILYKLAKSDNPWERRTAMVSTAWFIRKDELDDTFKIAEILLEDDHEYVQKAIGTWIRHAGKQDEDRLHEFLEKHASKIERTTLTTMMENLTKDQKEYYRSL
jgi:3-methyladenine DNA glycosylase AlkD